MNTSLGRGLIFFVLLSSSFLLRAQDFSFEQSQDVIVIENGDTLVNPWSGGTNYVHVSDMDLDLDGQMDIVIFDKSGDRISPYLYTGSGSEIKYEFAPQYISAFPSGIKFWMISRDYDDDGKQDLFYHVSAGIGVARNVSTQATGLKFQWILTTPQLYSDYGSGNPSNLYVSSNDIPAIADVDADGDLDILTFSILGGTVEFHENLSQDNYNNNDTLLYKLSEQCWGNFTEANTYNKVFLDSCLGQQKPGHGSRHAGSTLLAFDEDGNGLIDLLLGDVTFNNGVMLYNGGTLAEANMTSQDTSFPVLDTPIDIEVFPGFFLLDVDRDGDEDLVASPNKKGGSLNFNSIWYYENTSSSTTPSFEYRQDNLFQDEQMDFGEGSYPRFFDENGDGLMDLVVGNWGYYNGNAEYHGRMSLYRNVGDSSEAVFELITRDFANLSSLSLGTGVCPTFGDVDDDGDQDMIIGDGIGKIHLFTNTAGAGNPPTFVLSNPNYLGVDVGNNATPFLIDLNQDGLIDLTIGDFYGFITYYQNNGTSSTPDFVFIKDSLGGVDASGIFGAFGYAVPYFFESNGSTRLALGSTHSILYFDSIDGNILGNWVERDSVFGGVTNGTEFGPAVHDLNGDGWVDMVVGNLSGGLTFYTGEDTTGIGIHEYTEALEYLIYPNPTQNSFRIKGNTSIVRALEMYDLKGRLVLQEEGENFNNEIRIQELETGFYVVLIHTEQGIVRKRLIVQ